MPVLQPHDPLALKKATREEVNARRDELEQSPLVVNNLLIDVDDRSEKRMRDALAVWDVAGLTSLDWTLADNTKQTLTKAELQSLYDQMLIARATRALQLHANGAVFKADATTTLRDIHSGNWG